MRSNQIANSGSVDQLVTACGRTLRQQIDTEETLDQLRSDLIKRKTNNTEWEEFHGSIVFRMAYL